MNRDEVLDRLTKFVSERLLDGSADTEITAQTPLLEWGIVNSINTMQLITFVREEIGVDVPTSAMSGKNFRDLGSITDLVVSLGAA